MFKSLSSRSSRSVSVSSSGTTLSVSSLATPTSSTFLAPTLPPIPPTPTRDIPSICVVSATPGTSSSPIVEKRRTRTLVPKRSVIGKENASHGESSRIGSLGRVRPKQTPTIPEQPSDPQAQVVDLVARQFVASQNERQVHTMGPSSGFSFVAPPRNPSPPTRQTSYRIKPSKSSKRILVENRADSNGGHVEVVKETISKSTRPISRIGSEVLDSLRGGTLTRGSSRAAKVGSTRVLADASVRGETTDENAGTAYVVPKKKSRGTLDSIRWALGDRTNTARKAEKEKEKAEKALEKSRRSQDSSGSERPRVKLTIDTRVPPVDKSQATTDTPSASVLSPVAETPAAAAESATDSEAVTSGTEKTRWKWTIGRKRTKSPGSALSPTERPGHGRTMSLDVEALLANNKPSEDRDEGLGTYARRRHRTASFDLPTLLQNVEAEPQVEGSSPLPLPPQPTPVEIAPVDFGQEPKSAPKTSTGSAETKNSSGTMRRSSIANMINGDNASNTGSLALRAMRSVRSIASIARLGGWGKGDDSDKSKEKEGTLKDRKKRKSRKMPIFDEDEATNTSGESWEAGALGRDPTVTETETETARIGQPIMPNLQLGDPRTDLGVGRPSRSHQEDGDWVAGDRKGSGSSSRVAPSTISFGKSSQPRMSNESSGSSNYPASSTHDTASITSSKPRRSSGMDYDSLFSIDTSETDSGTMKGRTQRKREASRPPPKSLMGLFEVPTVAPTPAPVPESPPHVEVQGVKIGKGRVRERVREFEARAEESLSPVNLSFGTMRSVSARHPGTVAPSVGRAKGKQGKEEKDTFFQDREHALSLGRSASVPLLVESPHRQAQARPKSEHLFRRLSQEDAASISMINAANSDLSDLINRLDLSATPDSKYQLSPPVCRAPPAFVQASPSKRSSHNPEEQQSLTALVGYNHSPVARTPSVEEFDVEIKHVLYKGKTSRASVFTFAPDSATETKSATLSTPTYQHPAAHTSPDSEQDTPRERSGSTLAKARRRTGTYGAIVEDPEHANKDEDHSDIPDELQAILSSQSEDESSPVLSSSSSLPLESRDSRQNSKVQFELPEHEEAQTDNEEVTFDFTGELGQLKGGSRNSFVEVLVSAFKTPALPAVGEGQLQLNIESPIRPLQSGEGSSHATTYSSGGRTPTTSQISTAATERPSEDAHPDQASKVFGKLPAARMSGTFDYDTLMRELDEVSFAVEGSTQGANRRRLHRLSTDSDRSSVFRGGRAHRRDEPTMTFSFVAPPVSFHNRPYNRQIAHSVENDNTGRLSWTGELPGKDSDDSDRFSRPGLGDKMFQSDKMFQMGTEHGLPLPSIMASPANSDGSAGQQAAYEDYTSGGFSYVADRRGSYVSDRRNSYAPSLADQKRMSFMSYDSYLEVPGNGNTRRSSVDGDSLFERRGRPSSISSVSVFGDDRRRRRSRAMFNPNYRPVSIISMQSETTGEDDTMVSMIGGADNSRVPRKSIATNLLLDASPCMRAEKRAKELARAQHIEANRAASLSALTGTPMGFTPSQPRSSGDSIFEHSPSRGRSCVPSRPFARPRPPGASKSIVDDSDDEEFSMSGQTPMPSMFNRRMSPAVGNTSTLSVRKRSSGLICTAEPPDTPPLSDDEISGISHASGSRSVNRLSNVSFSAQAPPSTGRRSRTKLQDHRHRLSHVSRSSVNLSISEDDLPRGASAFVSRSHSSADSSVSDSVIIVNPDAQMAEMIEMIGAGYVFSNEQLEAVTRYCALRNEAVETVTRSQKIWQDTDFSRFTLSTFVPPTNSTDIKAMIDHSQSTYNEIPVEVYRRPRTRHPRSCARASPYHVSRQSFKSTMSPRTRLATESIEHALTLLPPTYDLISRSPRPVPESPYPSHTAMGLLSPGPGARAMSTMAPLSPLVVNVQPTTSIEEKSSRPGLRPRTGSGSRSALGWGKKPSVGSIKAPVTQTGGPTAAKENEAAGTLSNNNHNLRLNRPRPKGRVASGTARPSTLRV
ncbi:Muscle M-line assembly protein unc-89 [Rhizoctonia solani]|uniref:Muscle M-line assembly protein unc-89 n=1 Tax=Rhizoctonia solani TaxID=456999 RepID=A0A0K6FP97_9AGAM|nr:Muscle M-line assembly protein unc-89 [Rhizoctonia solani]